jgi:hypothetical protein
MRLRDVQGDSGYLCSYVHLPGELCPVMGTGELHELGITMFGVKKQVSGTAVRSHARSTIKV